MSTGAAITLDDRAETSSPRRLGWAVPILLIIAIFVSRAVLLASLPQGWLFNVDEREMALSSSDRLLGVPSTSLAWPGGTIHLITLPTIGVDYIINSGKFGRSPTGFLDYLGHTYRSTTYLVQRLRGWVALIFAVGCAALFRPLARTTGSSALAVFIVLALATSPHLWLHSHMSTGDAISIGLSAIAVALLLEKDPTLVKVGVAGALCGLAVASKITIVPAILLVFAMVLGARRDRVNTLLLWLLFAGIGFLIACPYIWVDPVRLAKSVLGIAFKPGDKLGLAYALRVAFSVIPLWMMTLLLASLIVLIARRQWWIAAGVIAGLLFAFASTARSWIIAPRYFLPLNILCLIAFAVAAREFAQTAWARERLQSKGARAALATVAGLLLVWNVIAYAREISAQAREALGHESLSPAQLRLVLAELNQRNLRGRILLPYGFHEHADSVLSVESIKQLTAAAERAAAEGRSVQTLASGAMREVLGALSDDFNEDERAYIARYRVAARVQPPQPLDAGYWSPRETAVRFGMPDREQAVQMAASGQVAAVILDNQRAAPPGAIKLGEKWLLLLPPPKS